MATVYYKPFQTEPIGEIRTEAEEPLPSDSVEASGDHVTTDELPSDSVEASDDHVTTDEGANQNDTQEQETTTDQNTVSLLDYQTEELRKYRNATSRMAHEIDNLRSHLRHLESENSAIKRELAVFTKPSAWMVDSAQLDTLSKSELIARYIAIKDKYQRQTDELHDYRDRVHKLQNNLLIKSDLDKDYLVGTTRNHWQMQKRLEEEMLKVKKLQSICRTQEDVIVEMEKRRDSSYHYYWHANKERVGFNESDRVGFSDTLYEENRRLRAELRRLVDLQSTYIKDDLDRYKYYDWWEQLVDDGRKPHTERLPILRDKTHYYYDYDLTREKKYPDPLKRLSPVPTIPTNSPRTNSDSWLPELTPRRGIYD